MSIADEMKQLTEDIVASYDTRVKAIGTIVKDTRNMLKGFQTEHKEMSDNLKAGLAKGEKDRLGDFSAMMAKIQGFVSDVANEVNAMIKRFQKEHKAMSGEQRENLAKGEADRAKAFKAMMGDINKGIKDIETYVASKLKEFNEAHADMSVELKKELAKYVAGVVSETGKLLGGFADESEDMAANWQALTATMAKKRGGQPLGTRGKPVVSAGQEVMTVEEAVKKPKKKVKVKAKAKGKGTRKGKKQKQGEW